MTNNTSSSISFEVSFFILKEITVLAEQVVELLVNFDQNFVFDVHIEIDRDGFLGRHLERRRTGSGEH